MDIPASFSAKVEIHREMYTADNDEERENKPEVLANAPFQGSQFFIVMFELTAEGSQYLRLISIADSMNALKVHAYHPYMCRKLVSYG
ncbi:hypothetical protein STEG23_005424 [Scotinomys teguina]